MITFYPGPSKLKNNLAEYTQQAFASGIVESNHRSKPFMALYDETIATLQEKLEVPANYEVFFTSSATECWQIIAQSLIQSNSYHIYNGAFGKKWKSVVNDLCYANDGYSYDCNQFPDLKKVEADNHSLFCCTHTETSNGSLLPSSFLVDLRKKFPNNCIAVDATSGMGGDVINFELADIWFASVQKCFGLPSGMAVMICSPRAIEKAFELNHDAHYNSIIKQVVNGRKRQTTHTPNILDIYLLNESLKNDFSIQDQKKRLLEHQNMLTSAIEKSIDLDFLIKNKDLQSLNVFAINHINPDDYINQGLKQNIVFGKGYGNWKDNTFRIANFPAHSSQDFKTLEYFINHG